MTKKHKTTPVDELLAAAFQLRNPFHGKGLQIPVDTDLADELAGWLEQEARRLQHSVHPSWQAVVGQKSLRVARTILQTPQEDAA